MATRTAMADKAKHRRGVLRAMGYGTVVAAVCGLAGVRYARAEVLDNSMVVGRQMMELANGVKNSAVKVKMNGQEMIFASQLSHDSPQMILDRYEKLCRENQAQSPEQWKDLTANAPAGANGKAIGDTGGVLRGAGKDEGTVMCFVKAAGSKATTREALDSFLATGEMGAIGQLRYVYVKKTAKGNSHVLAAWTLDSFNVNQMMPQEGDAPGEEFPGLERPKDSRRLFSARIEGAPYGINVYESGNDPKELANGYDQKLTKDGWFALDIEGKASKQNPALNGVTGRVYEKDGVMMTIVSRIEDKKTVTAFGLAGMPDREEPTSAK